LSEELSYYWLFLVYDGFSRSFFVTGYFKLQEWCSFQKFFPIVEDMFYLKYFFYCIALPFPDEASV